ncbi:MAG: hydroxyacid dehydrogenase [Actinomycetia bacterium]|nr:hydroxyacid dehydrogenase [Actinomycetes bacterium]
MKILFADAISEPRLDVLRKQGHEIIVEPSLRTKDLPSRISGIETLVVRSTKVDEALIASADSLGLIVRAGAGTDNIDTSAASARGVFVCNVPGRNAVAVAELTMGLLLAIDRRIVDNAADLRAGVWNKGLYSKANGILGSTIAIIGVGDIGLAVAERAKAFGMSVTAQRRDNRSPEVQARIRTIGIRLVDNVDELLADADVVSLHVPKAADTTGMVDRTFLAKMRPGSILLNTSRANVIEEAALLEAIDAKQLRVGLDVWPSEPSAKDGAFSSQLGQHPLVIGTHHIGASTAQAQDSVAEGTVAVIDAYARGHVINCVNLDRDAVGTSCLTVRHLDQVGVLAQVFQVLRTNGFNVQQVQNQIFTGAAAAVATVYVDGQATDALLEQMNGIPEVLAAASVTVDGT